jgi:hypothetical protein
MLDSDAREKSIALRKMHAIDFNSYATARTLQPQLVAYNLFDLEGSSIPDRNCTTASSHYPLRVERNEARQQFMGESSLQESGQRQRSESPVQTPRIAFPSANFAESQRKSLIAVNLIKA